MNQNPILRIFSTGLAVANAIVLPIVFFGCADSSNISTDCNVARGSSCAFDSSGGEIEWKLERLQPGDEYVVAVLSRAKPDRPQEFQHSLNLRSDVSSAGLPKEEAKVIDSVRSRQRTSNSQYGQSVDTNFVFSAPSANEIPSPQNIDLSAGSKQKFFIPDTQNADVQKDNEPVKFFVHTPSGPVVSGKEIAFQFFDRNPGVFSIFYNPTVFKSNPQNENSEVRKQFQDLRQCLDHVIPEAEAYLGTPLVLAGKSELQILFTQFEDSGSRTLGLFSFRDRFMTEAGKALPDSNRAPIIYQTALSHWSRSCSTTVHELQHLISFDYKVLRQIPEDSRGELEEMRNRHLSAEELGLNEAYSHIVEELSGESQIVTEHIYNFLTRPNGATLTLEAAWSDLFSNSRSRGFNTLLLYHTLRLGGATLNREDARTQTILRDLIHSPKTGIANIADYLQMSETDFLSSFFTKFIMSLYSPDNAQNFIPALENNGRFPRGIKFIDRKTPYDSVPFKPPVIHPLQVDIPLLSQTESHSLPAGGVHFYRFIVPRDMPRDSHMRMSLGGYPFSAFLVHAQ